jgi:tetratricopeptide (TPR) repeat protein
MKFQPPFSKNEEWLLKSAGRILGPFTTSEVVNGIQSRRFSLMDEISKNSGRWKLVRDEPTFLDAVKSLRNLIEDNSEKTSTSTVTMQSITDFKINIDEDTLTPIPPSSVQQEGTEGGELKKIKARERDLASASTTSGYGFVKDVKFRTRIKNENDKRWVWIGLLGLFIIAGVGFYIFQTAKKKNSPEAFQEFVNKGLVAKSQGLNKKALEFLTRAKQLGAHNSKVDIELATLQIVVDKQTIIGRRTIEKLLTENQNSSTDLDKSEFHTKGYSAIGLSYLLDLDFKNAIDTFEKAKSFNSNYLPPQINEAVVYFQERDFNRAESTFSKLLESNQNDGYLIIGISVSAFESMKNSQTPLRNYPLVSELISEYLKENIELNQELSLLQTYALIKQGLKDEASLAIRKTLSVDSEASALYSYDILVDRSLASWKILMPYCSSISNEMPKSVEAKALLAYCYFKSGRDEEAKLTILQADSQSPKNPIVQLSRAILLKSFGQEGEAQAALSLALNDESLLATYGLKAKSCEDKGDFNCAETYWNKLIEINPKSVQAYAGLAAVSLKKKNKSLAQEYINKGQAISRTFLPLWDLRNQL